MVIISGGYYPDSGSWPGPQWIDVKTVEAMYSDGSHLCILPDMPFGNGGSMSSHVHYGLVICDGDHEGPHQDPRGCFTLTPDGWVHSHDLKNSHRYGSVSFATDNGLVIMGGYNDAAGNAEQLDQLGGSNIIFNLRYPLE